MGLLRARLPMLAGRLPGTLWAEPSARADLCVCLCLGLHHFLHVLRMLWLCLTQALLNSDPPQSFIFTGVSNPIA